MYMLIGKIEYTYICDYCKYTIKTNTLEHHLCPVCKPEIMIESLKKYTKEIKDEQNRKNSSDKT